MQGESIRLHASPESHSSAAILCQALVGTAPEQAKTLLNGHPQLSYALFQAMLMMNVVDPNILQVSLSVKALPAV